MFRLHSVWIDGLYAGEHRTWDLEDLAVATKTMNMMLAGGVCAWIERVN